MEKVPELLDKVNEFTKQYSVENIFDVSIMEVLDKEIEIQYKRYLLHIQATDENWYILYQNIHKPKYNLTFIYFV